MEIGALHSIFPIETHPPNGKSRTQNERQDVGVDRICVCITECQLNLVLESKGRRKKPYFGGETKAVIFVGSETGAVQIRKGATLILQS